MHRVVGSSNFKSKKAVKKKHNIGKRGVGGNVSNGGWVGGGGKKVKNKEEKKNKNKKQ